MKIRMWTSYLYLNIWKYWLRIIQEGILKFRIRETLNLSACTDSSTDTKTNIKGKHRKSCEKLPWELVGCQGVKVFFTKRCHYNYFCHYCHFYNYHNLSFWVWSQFDLSSFVTTFIFLKFYHSLSYWVLPQLRFFFLSVWFFFSFVNFRVFFFNFSQFGFFSFVTIWVFKFCRNLSFWVLSQFQFWVLSQFSFLVLSQFEFLNFVTFKNFVFGPSFSFWVLSQFEFLSFVSLLLTSLLSFRHKIFLVTKNY